MKMQAIVRLWVLLLATPMSSEAMSQAVIKYEFFTEPYNFHLAGTQWGTVHGLNFELRQSFGSLLGEPVTNNNVRYWFDGQEDGINKPTVHLYRKVIGTPQTQGIPYPKGDTWAIIELWGGDDISVTRAAGVLKVSYPFERFIDQVLVVSAHFVGNYGQINMLGGFNGVFSRPGNWGWNIPGSPSWSRALVSSYKYIDHGSQPIHWYSESEARDLFAMLIKECQPVCQGQAQRLQDLNLNMYGVLNDIAAHSEAFRMAYYKSDQRATMLRSLVSAAQSEPDPQLRKRREALANRAMKAFGDEQSQTFKQQRRFAVSANKRSATEQAMAVSNEALCQMMAEGEVQDDTLARLKQLVQKRGILPRQLQDRAEESLKLLSKKVPKTGPLWVTVASEAADNIGTSLVVTKPDGTRGYTHAYTLPKTWVKAQGGKYDEISLGYGDTEAPAGKYKFKVRGSGDYLLLIWNNGTRRLDIFHEGHISKGGGADIYELTHNPNRTDEGQRCHDFTAL